MIHVIHHCLLLQGLLDLFQAVTPRSKIQVKFKSIKIMSQKSEVYSLCKNLFKKPLPISQVIIQSKSQLLNLIHCKFC